jgi:hypothetical protein
VARRSSRRRKSRSRSAAAGDEADTLTDPGGESLSEAAPRLRSANRDLFAVLGLFALALLLFAATASLAAQRAGVPLGSLAIHYDGLLYLTIAKSFPTPFAPEALHYASHPPGFPALVWLVHWVVPPSVAGWDLVMLWTTWLCGALSTVAFYVLCRTAGVTPLLPSLLFLLGNPAWIHLGATAHAEPLALLLLILSLIAYLREHLTSCGALLALAALTRYPALVLVAPVVFTVVLVRQRINVRTLLPLGLPILVVGLMSIYLFQRIPDFHGLWDAHKVFWDTGFSVPFLEMFRHLPRYGSDPSLHSTVTYASLAVYLLAVVVGLLRRNGKLLLLPLWVATLVGFQVSLNGHEAFQSFVRFALLAWPPTVLILWRWIGARLPRSAVLGFCLASGVLGLWFAQRNIAAAIALAGDTTEIQKTVEQDEPVWLDFRGGGRQRARTR